MAVPRILQQTAMEITGLDELRDQLANVAPREARNILRNTVNGIAGKVRDQMKQRVKKRSHDLEKSIYVLRRRGKPNFPVSDVRLKATPHPHGLILEFGTHKTRAQPYIVPTVEAMRPTMPDEYREQFGKKLEAALAKAKK